MSALWTTDTEFEQLYTSQPSSSNDNPENGDNSAPGSSFEEPAPTDVPALSASCESGGLFESIFTEDLFRYNQLSSGDDFCYEDNHKTNSPFGDPMEAIEVELAAFEQFCKEFKDLEQWRYEYSYLRLESPRAQPDDTSESSQAVDSDSPAAPEGPLEVTLDMVNTQDGVNAQTQRMLNAAWRAPRPPTPEKSIFRNREPYDTYGYPPKCFYIDPPSKKTKEIKMLEERRGRRRQGRKEKL